MCYLDALCSLTPGKSGDSEPPFALRKVVMSERLVRSLADSASSEDTE